VLGVFGVLCCAIGVADHLTFEFNRRDGCSSSWGAVRSARCSNAGMAMLASRNLPLWNEEYARASVLTSQCSSVGLTAWYLNTRNLLLPWL
jgi:hypothetical protein